MATDPQNGEPDVRAARGAVLRLLAARRPSATICPSEVARTLAAGDRDEWRAAMPVVHAAVDTLVAEGLVQLSWKGATMPVREGPYRIASVRRRAGVASVLLPVSLTQNIK